MRKVMHRRATIVKYVFIFDFVLKLSHNPRRTEENQLQVYNFTFSSITSRVPSHSTTIPGPMPYP
jgi:hypothetical protein